MPQDLAIYLDLTGMENLLFFARLYGLADHAGDQVKTYSGGMKRRLNVGLGLLNHPELLILDEPAEGRSRCHWDLRGCT